MINPLIENKLDSDYSNIGAVVCNTPKTILYTYTDDSGEEILVDHRCELINSIEDLIDYYGDPFIDPVKYHDLIIAYNLVSSGTYIYVSSIDNDVLKTNDEFRTDYNGYTEFSFTSNGYDTIGYRLKSDIKFCQPIIRSRYAINRLDIYVDLYILDRSLIHNSDTLRTFNSANLYKTLRYTFDTSKKTTVDQSIVNALSQDGLELQIVNADPLRDTSLIDEFKSYKNLIIHFNSYDEYKESINEPYDLSKIERNTKTEHYWYRLNSDKYVYDFDDINKVINSYIDAITRLSEKKPEPHNLLLSRIYKSITVKDSDGLIVRSLLDDIDYDSYLYIQSSLLELFQSNCYTYCYLSMPDISVVSIIDLLDGNHIHLPDNYNCDLYYGSISDYVVSSNLAHTTSRVHFPLASMVFYNLVYRNSVYTSNPLSGMNISNDNIKFIISESTALTLANLRCNSLASFDSDKPTIYGNRSLSPLPNLGYSHIARHFVRIRRTIHEYLETKKFILNTYFNVQSCLDYIRVQIIEPYIESGVLSNYNIDYTVEHQTVIINVALVFARALNSINLEFTI